jgi:hypothetical protein
MKDSLISENTKKFSILKKEQFLQRITKFKEMRIQIFLMQNQSLLYEVFPLKFKQKAEDSGANEKKQTNNLRNMSLDRFREFDMGKDYQYIRENQKISKENIYSHAISNTNTHAIQTRTSTNLKTRNSEQDLDKGNPLKYFPTINNIDKIKNREKPLPTLSSNYDSMTEQNINSEHKEKYKSRSKKKKKTKKPVSSNQILTQNNFFNLNTNIASIPHLTNVEKLVLPEFVNTDKTSSKENKFVDCLTMDNFNRSYNTNFYFSKNPHLKIFFPQNNEKKNNIYSDIYKPESDKNPFNPELKFEYLITQDSIRPLKLTVPNFFNSQTANPGFKNFQKKNLDKKFVIKNKDTYSNVCIRNKSKRTKNVK